MDKITKHGRILGIGLVVASSFVAPPIAFAADPIVQDQIPEPPAIDLAQKGIWGAIAFSPDDGKRGIFWGADTRADADSTAQRYCEKAGGSACKVVVTFRNHRHWSDNDQSGFPYEHCAALVAGGQSSWGAASGKTSAEATAKAASSCGDGSCKPVETVCT